MNALDIILLAGIGVCAIYGLVRGFVRIAIGVAGLALSLAIALSLASKGPQWFGGFISSEDLASLFAFAVLFIGGLVVTALAAWLARKLIKAAQISWIDRLVGATIGFFGASLAAAAIVTALTTFLPTGTGVLAESRVVPVVTVVADIASAALPSRLSERYRERRDALRNPPPESSEQTPQAEPEPQS